MDVVGPHMKKGKKARLDDHLIKWSKKSGAKREKQTPEQMLNIVKGVQATYNAKTPTAKVGR